MKTSILKTLCITLFALVYTFNTTNAQTVIWNGPITTFTKPNFADYSDSNYQDHITNNVWITRANIQGIFNIATESSYASTSPADTEWAYGTTANLGSLTFNTWVSTIGKDPPSMVGQNMVLHLISEDIYIDIKFTQWSEGKTTPGGGFSYERSTNSPLNITDLNPKLDFKITPNPSNNYINLILPESNYNNVQVTFYNVLGERLHTISLENNSIDVSGFNTGLYFIKVTTPLQTQTKQFIKL